MNLVELDLLIHYGFKSEDHPQIAAKRVAESYREGLQRLINLQLIRRCPVPPNSQLPQYQVTERGQIYLQMLQRMPLPTEQWAIPSGLKKHLNPEKTSREDN